MIQPTVPVSPRATPIADQVALPDAELEGGREPVGVYGAERDRVRFAAVRLGEHDRWPTVS